MRKLNPVEMKDWEIAEAAERFGLTEEALMKGLA